MHRPTEYHQSKALNMDTDGIRGTGRLHQRRRLMDTPQATQILPRRCTLQNRVVPCSGMDSSYSKLLLFTICQAKLCDALK